MMHGHPNLPLGPIERGSYTLRQSTRDGVCVEVGRLYVIELANGVMEHWFLCRKSDEKQRLPADVREWTSPGASRTSIGTSKGSLIGPQSLVGLNASRRSL